MRSQYRFVALTCLLILCAFVAAGCGAAAPTLAAEPVTLKFAVIEGAMPIERLAQEFHQAHPNITIEYHEAPGPGTSALEAYLEAGGADIFRFSRDAMARADEGLLKPLDEIHLEPWDDIRDDYYGGLWETLAASGVQYGIPAGMDIYVAYVNAGQAQALGAGLPPTNWDQFDMIDFAMALNSWDASIPSDTALVGFGTDPMGMDPLIFVYAHGGAIVDDIENPRQALLDDPLTIDATQAYAELFTRYQIAPTPQTARRLFPRGGIYEAQARGRCAIWFGWFSQRGGLGYYEWQPGWQMYHLPHDQIEMEMGSVEGYYIADSCEHPHEALTFIRFLSDRWDASGQALPPRLSLQESKSYRDTLDDDLESVVDSFAKQIVFLPGGYTPELEAVGGAFYEALNQIITQDLSAADVLIEAQRRVHGVFE